MASSRAQKWTKFSKDYEAKVYSVTSSKPRRRMFLRHVHGKMVLNLGTGPLPYMNRDLIRLGFRVVATDFSDAMLTAAKKAFVHERLVYVKADNVALPCRDGSVDTILAINSILPQRREEVDVMLSECRRVVGKHGVLVGFFPSWETSLKAKDRLGLQEKMDEQALRIHETNGWQCYQTHLTLRRHLENAGFRRVSISPVFLKSREEIQSMKRIYGIDTSRCFMFEHLAIAS